MYISVQFQKWDGDFSGKKYAYVCNVDDVKVGDLVVVPVGPERTEKTVRVCEINVRPGAIDVRAMEKMKHVIRKGTAETDTDE